MKLGLDIWQEIYSTIKQNKMRTFLTGFSVAWGIFMLIVLLGSGNGLMNGMNSNFADRARNSISIYPGRTSMTYDGLQSGRNVELDNIDLRMTEQEFSNNVITAGATVYQTSQNISFGQEYVTGNVVGVYPSYTEVRSCKVKEGNGRFINQLDLLEHRRVIVIHEKAQEILFRKHTAIGKFVNIGGIAYQIVGVYTADKYSNDQDVYAPFTTVQLIYNRGNKLGNILFTTKNLATVEANEKFEKDYRKVIGSHHRFNPEDKNSLYIRNSFTDYLETMKAQGILNIAIWVIGIFTLLSGIVGVSNIMLIAVKERTKEFGIRKALGASPASILWLIILESIFITTIFGYIGMVMGIGVTEYASGYFDAQAAAAASDTMSFTIFKDPTVSINVAIQATIVLIIAGTLAGFFPARKAVQIKPIEALRAE